MGWIPSAFKSVKAVVGMLILLVVLASSTWGLYQSYRASQYKQEAKVATESLKATNNAVTQRHAAQKAHDAAEAEATRSLEDSINANPEWGATRTPDAVVDSLCSYIPCASRDSSGGLPNTEGQRKH